MCYTCACSEFVSAFVLGPVILTPSTAVLPQPRLSLQMPLPEASNTLTLQLPAPRKRTSSFCYPTSPRPAKAPRVSSEMGSTLRRTESYISLADIRPVAPVDTRRNHNDQMSLIPYHRTMQYYKEQRDRERRRGQMNRSVEPITIRIRSDVVARPTVRRYPTPQPLMSAAPASQTPSRSVPSSSKCAPPTVYTPPRQSSPLSPARATIPGRPVFPRSKAEPDLYRKAIKTSMKKSPEGQKILRMGPRLALSITTATQELERIVAAQTEREDVAMLDATTPILTKSWVVVPGEDWEMVDCAA